MLRVSLIPSKKLHPNQQGNIRTKRILGHGSKPSPVIPAELVSHPLPGQRGRAMGSAAGKIGLGISLPAPPPFLCNGKAANPTGAEHKSHRSRASVSPSVNEGGCGRGVEGPLCLLSGEGTWDGATSLSAVIPGI